DRPGSDPRDRRARRAALRRRSSGDRRGPRPGDHRPAAGRGAHRPGPVAGGAVRRLAGQGATGRGVRLLGPGPMSVGVHQDVAAPAALLTGPPPAAVLYRSATASPATARLVASDLPLVLIHHNITPPHFFWGVDVAHHEGCRAAIDELPWLRDRVLLAVGHSEFTRRHLETLGFRRTAAVPLMLGEQPQPELPPGRLRDEIAAAPTLLSVGRIAPNKRLEDTVRLLHAYRQGVEPRARLW